MASIIKIYALFIGSALLMFGGGLQGLLLSVRGAEEQFSVLSLGLIGTGWSVGFVTGSIVVPMIVRKVGHIRAYSVMAAIGTVTILLNLLIIHDYAWITLRALSGFCFAGAAMIVESWLNEVAENRNRGTVFSIYVTINMAASTIGQLAIAITGVAGYLPFVIGAISFICAVLPTALTSSPQPRPLSSAKLDVPLLFRTSPLAVIAAFSVGMANGTFGTLAPVYGYAQGLDAAGIAYLFSVTAIAGAIGQIPIGRLSDRIDRRVVLIALALAAALIGALLVLLNPSGGIWLYVLFAIYGLAANPIYAIAVAHANDFAKDGQFARIAGGMLLVLGLGLAIGPIIAAIVMNLYKPVGLFIITASFHGALAIMAFLRMRIRPVRDANGRVRFRPMGPDRAITPETGVLDPRADDFAMAAERAATHAPAAAAPPAVIIPPVMSGEILPPETSSAAPANPQGEPKHVQD
ncbi:MAG: transporter [Devosia sp.]|nr:transporter [Devosia sp.]